MTRSSQLLVLVCLAGSGVACSDASQIVHAPTEFAGSATYSVSRNEESARDVTRALALALGHREVRILVRNAMRASRVTEHKLVLHEFLATPAGRHVLHVAARESGLGPDALTARVRALPPLDFYLPFREHRLRWRATEDVLIGTALDQEQPSLHAFEPTGGEIILQQKDGIPARALLLLHPAEPKGLRVDAQPDVPGDVIQDASDGELSGSIEWVDADGRVHTTPLASMGSRAAVSGRQQQIGTLSLQSTSGSTSPPVDEVICVPDDPATCPNFNTSPGTVLADTALMSEMEIFYGDGWGGRACEIELRTKYFSGGVEVDRRTLRLQGVIADGPLAYYGEVLMYRRLREGSSDYFRVHVVETDFGGDDDKGVRIFNYRDNGQHRSVIHDGGWWTGQSVTNIKLAWTPVW